MPVNRHLTQALYVAAVALGRTRDAGEVVRVAIAETQRAAGIEAISLYLLDSGRQSLILREYAGTSQAFRERMALLPLTDAHVAHTAIRERRFASCAVDEHPTPTLRVLYKDQGFRHVSAVPVAGREEILGVLYLATRQEPPLSQEEVSLVQAIGGLVGVALENAALREAMTAQQVGLRALAGGILQAREAEARRIAHALHDEASQLLASVHIALDDLNRRIPEHSATLGEIHTLLDRVEDQLRRLSRELRPTILDDLGLAPAIEWLAQGVAQRTGMAITVEAPEGRISSGIETALYRIVQEALTNAVRHSRATEVKVIVKDEGSRIVTTIRDNGQGFDVAATLARQGDRGLGLIGIRERIEALGGDFSISSDPGKGTELVIVIPWSGSDDSGTAG